MTQGLHIEDRIEILSVSLLDEARPLVEEFRALSRRLEIQIGWHYLLDFVWIAQQLRPVPNLQVMDAGAGWGTMQWWLAERGVNVISVDRSSRRDLPYLFRRNYRVRGLREEDLATLSRPGLPDFLPPLAPGRWRRYPEKLAAAFGRLRSSEPEPPSDGGTVVIYNSDLASLPGIPDASLDAVVSVSALEHNQPEELRVVVAELMRVLKPGGRLIATLSAARDEDWFHRPAQGWCYTEATLRDIFALSADCPTNYDRYTELFQALRASEELRTGLAPVYFTSGENGMPWGEWNPEYQPVGIVRQKAAA
jgi:SAM-dependent methyltransferase